MNTRRIAQLAVGLAAVLCAQGLMATPAPGVRLSKLKGADVKGKNGEELGKLEDVVINPSTGQIAFAIVGNGTLLGLGDKPHPVPWQEVKVNSEKEVTINIDKQKLQSAPTVTQGYSELNNPEEVVVIYRFYAIEPPGTSGGQPR